MKFDPLAIDGAYKITPRKLGDARGAFARVYCEDMFREHGLNTNWVQMNSSINVQKGQVRGLHFQRSPHAEIKLVRCVLGKIHDVIVDLRAGSSTYGKSCSLILDSENLEMIYIPKGFAHGFQILTDKAILHYSHSDAYAPNFEGGVSVLDTNLSIDWPLPIENLSQRDRSFPMLKELEPIAP